MSKTKTSNIIIRIIAVLLVVALLGAGIALIYRYTNGFNEDFKTFYIEYNGEKVLQSKSEMNFLSGTEATFHVKYTFDLENEERDYNVKVYPNEEESFEYTVDDRYLVWRAAGETADLSSAFGLKKGKDSFTLSFPSEMTAQTVLQSCFPGQKVSVDTEALKGKKIYRLVVSSYNEEVSFVIDFSVGTASVTLDRENILFGGDQP